MGPILVVAELANGTITDGTKELLTKAQSLAKDSGTSVAVLGFGSQAKDALSAVAADEAFLVAGSDAYVPFTYEQGLSKVVGDLSPSLILAGNTTMGLDLGAGLAAQRNMPLIAYCTALENQGGKLVATSQVYGGKLLAEVAVPESAVITVIPGTFGTQDAQGSPKITDVSNDSASPMGLLRVIEAESGDVDITRSDILVSVGRGIQDPDNIELADEMAEAVGGVVSCSRPVVDSGWLPRSRQVGKSGLTVKPKVYFALGISGAPEHLQGMKDSELIIAVNADPNAPIMEHAHFGATVDILDLMPVLTERLKAGGA